MTPIENVLSRLDRVRASGKDKWTAVCPAHEDRDPSLSIGIGAEGRVLLKCFAGCDVDSICHSLGIEQKDLFTDAPSTNGTRPHEPPKVTRPVGRIVATYDYTDAEANLLFQSVRYEPKTFSQRKPDPTRPGAWIWSLRGVPLVLYRLKAVLEAKAAGRPIYLVEGEKDADNLAALGFCATTNPMGALKWEPGYTETLAGCHVVVIPDNDSKGRLHADRVCRNLHKVAKSLRLLTLPGPPEMKDASDWIAAGGTFEALRELCQSCPVWLPDGGKVRITRFSASELLGMEFPRVKWAIPEFVSEGVTLLAGPPKIGKSFLLLDWAKAIVTGGLAMNKVAVARGEVLYLALEDTPRRLKQRLDLLFGEEEEPAGMERLFFATEFDRFGEEHHPLEEEIEKHPDLRIVFIDTLAKMRRFQKPGGSVYQDDYEAINDLTRISNRHGVPIVAVHHTKKGKHDDLLEAISGSTGLTGAVDGIVILNRPRCSSEGTVFVSGRDADEMTRGIQWDAETCQWTLDDDPEAFRRSEERQEVLDVLATAGQPLTPAAISALVNKPGGTVRKLLFKMKHDGEVRKEKNGYVRP